MSLWGATVITSLASAIPVVGNNIVSYLWGGFKKKLEALDHRNVIIKTLIDAGISCSVYCKILQDLYIYFMRMLLVTVLQNKVKIMYTIAESAGLVKQKGKENFLSAYNTVTNSQRLHSKDLMWFVGFVEADGAFSINKNGKYAKYEFSIELSKKDVQLLYKIKSMLVVGSISFCTRGDFHFARFQISSKKDLILNIIPIFDKYNMLTNKHFDFIHFKSCLLKNIVYYADVPLYTRPKDSYLKVSHILKVGYFDCWFVGFIEAEGCFTSYVDKKLYQTVSFEISQTNALEIILAIKKRLNIKPNPYLYNSNYKLKITSTRGVQNVLKFLKQTPAKLKGNKRSQYLKWLHCIRANPRFKHINVPFKY